ncbi:hypothetical protein GP486_001609 [Trichoglossum hirsutum]|uniref:Uncharacterized protein n=1 Tax=Trichoglossum hirsutum TaxID=265104 RepID=A0A9P8LGU3_9PEZI|nr:hypothetical protein GP486_001609 [Trichoglossum hirsutum]
MSDALPSKHLCGPQTLKATSNVNSTFIAQIGYLDPLPLYRTEKPFMCTIPMWYVPNARQTNFSSTLHTCEIKDIRGAEFEFQLDVHGFQIEHYSTEMSAIDFDKENVIREKYYEECKRFLCNRFGAEKVFIFDYMVSAESFGTRKTWLERDSK